MNGLKDQETRDHGLEDRGSSDSTPPGAEAWFRRLTLYSVLAGLCPLIPVPLLDDHILQRVKRRMVREIAAGHGLRLPDWQEQHLAGGVRRRVRGCLIGAIASTALRILGKLSRRLFRKIIVILAIKEAVDTTSRTFHEGYLLQRAIARGDLHLDASGESATRLRQAVESVCVEVDTRPIHQVVRRSFRGSWRLARRGARLLLRRRDGSLRQGEAELPVEEESQLLGGVLDRLTAGLWRERGYLLDLERRLAAHLGSAPVTRDP